jgi:hypothetical protein
VLHDVEEGDHDAGDGLEKRLADYIVCVFFEDSRLYC